MIINTNKVNISVEPLLRMKNDSNRLEMNIKKEIKKYFS